MAPRRTAKLEEAEHEGADPTGRLEALDDLRLLAHLDPRERRIVQALAEGATFAELAAVCACRSALLQRGSARSAAPCGASWVFRQK